MNWLNNNWEKIFTVFMSLLSVIIAGVIGFYSSNLAIQSRINEAEKNNLTLSNELEKKILSLKNELSKEISVLDNKFEKEFVIVKSELSIGIKPKLNQIDKQADQLVNFNDELRNLKHRTDNIFLQADILKQYEWKKVK